MLKESVSLLVRLWVEMLSGIARYRLGLSASLWGCELKFDCLFAELPLISQPPCEAVSWNMANVTTYTTRAKSASLWGCELKFLSFFTGEEYGLSASLWGCELKLSELGFRTVSEVSLLVRLWVEISGRLRKQVPESLSASLWGCELKWVILIYMLMNILSASLWGCELKCTYVCTFSQKVKSASLWGCELKLKGCVG